MLVWQRAGGMLQQTLLLIPEVLPKPLRNGFLWELKFLKSPRRDLIKVAAISRQRNGSPRVGTAARGWEGEVLGTEQGR